MPYAEFRRGLATALSITVLGLCIQAPIASAGLVDTDTAAASSEADTARQQLASLLARDDVRSQLRALGIEPSEARARVGALSDAEVLGVARRLREEPAGGGFVGIVVGVIVVTFAVLLFTDLLGFTDVFPFIDPLPRGTRKDSSR